MIFIDGADTLIKDTLMLSGRAEYGGSVYCTSSTPIKVHLESTKIFNSIASSGGGGGYSSVCSINLVESVVSNNMANSGNGGGWLLSLKAEANIVLSTFDNNVAGHLGGAIACELAR